MKESLALVILLLCAATLFAEPESEEEQGATLGMSEAFGVGEDQGEVLAGALASASPRQLRLDATFLRVAAAAADELLGEHRPGETGSVRPIPLALARRLIGSVRGQGAVRPEPLPPLVLYDGQTGRLSITGDHTYLQDYDAEVGLDHFAYVPVVGRLEEGVRLDVTPRRRGERLELDVHAVWAEVVRPVPRFSTSLSTGTEKVTIELPELRLFQVKKTGALAAEGGYLLAGVGRAWGDESLRLVVVEVRPAKR